MLIDLLEKLRNLPFPVFGIGIGLLSGVALGWILGVFLRISVRKDFGRDLRFFRKRGLAPSRIFLPILCIFIALHYSVDSAWTSLLITTFKVLLIVSAGFLLIRMVYMLEDIFMDHYDISKEDNRKERKIITQLNFMRKAIVIAVVLVTFSLVLLSFEGGRRYGQALLTSAGVASIILGFAAQKTIANFLAGIQIAFTQPIKLDDAVVVEGEWGWIEEINLTYAVVRIWDWRRLILPITYFVDKPFQNWTRNKGEIIGTVFLHLDYRTPIEVLRKELENILANEPNWDGKVNNLQVVDTKEYTVVVRALMSAKNSPMAWDLRCSVREKMIHFLQSKYPDSLPTQRIQIDGNPTNSKL